jgi:hypothetical protein
MYDKCGKYMVFDDCEEGWEEQKLTRSAAVEAHEPEAIGTVPWRASASLKHHNECL